MPIPGVEAAYPIRSAATRGQRLGLRRHRPRGAGRSAGCHLARRLGHEQERAADAVAPHGRLPFAVRRSPRRRSGSRSAPASCRIAPRSSSQTAGSASRRARPSRRPPRGGPDRRPPSYARGGKSCRSRSCCRGSSSAARRGSSSRDDHRSRARRPASGWLGEGGVTVSRRRRAPLLRVAYVLTPQRMGASARDSRLTTSRRGQPPHDAGAARRRRGRSCRSDRRRFRQRARRAVVDRSRDDR